MECTCCGKGFDYPPAISRLDNRPPVCRICSAKEALETAGIKESVQQMVLEEVKEHEISVRS